VFEGRRKSKGKSNEEGAAAMARRKECN